MAWIPPILKILVTPQRLAVYKIAGFIFPFLSGGVQRVNSWQLAIFAGTANIKTVENKGAEPPGIYSPTFWIGLFSCQQITPSVVSTVTLLLFCALWNFSMFVFAKLIALFNSLETSFSALAISSAETNNSSNAIPSKNWVYFFTAASPFCFTSEKTSFTVASISAMVWVGRFKRSLQVSGLGLYIFFIFLKYHFFYWAY